MNNPFAPQSSSHVANVLNPFGRTANERFPDISQTQDSASIQPNFQQYSSQPQSYIPQQQVQPQPQYQPAWQSPAQTGFQPTTQFGQQLQYQMTGAVANVAEFDPYGSYGIVPNTFASAPPASRSPAPFIQNQAPSLATPTQYGAHPRTIVENNKAALESWSQSAWSAFNKSLENLKQAWEQRKASILRGLEAQGGRQLQYDEQQRFASLLKEADERIDMLTASQLQIAEVESGYRHSTDASSRARVRQALNESLRSWPDWPEELFVGTVQPTSFQPSPSPQPVQYQQQPSPSPQPMQYQQQQQQQYTGQYIQPQPTQYAAYQQQGNPAYQQQYPMQGYGYR